MKNRLITPYTEIQSDQLNELQEYNKDNFRILIDDIVGCTSGTAKGLATSISDGASRIITVTSGVVCDGNGLFYELPQSGTITLPNTDGTHLIYALQGSATGGATSGYVLFDIVNQIEDFQTIYTLTYDAISINSTTSTIPSNSHLIATGTVAGGTLTVLTDMRTYVQLGNIISNTLNGMSIDSRNTAFIANEITGTVMKRTGKKPFVETIIDNAFAGVGLDIINGTNASTTGIAITTSGNKGIRIVGTGISFEASNSTGYVDTSSSIGFKSSAPTGFVGEGTIGFISLSTTGFKATGATGFVGEGTRGFVSTSVTGYTSNGTTSDTVGFMSNINSTNAVGFKGMVVDGIGVQLLKNALTVNSKTALDINSYTNDSTSTFAKAMSIKNSNLGIHYYNPDVANSTGIVIESANANDDYGISLYNMYKGISIYDDTGYSRSISITKDVEASATAGLNIGIDITLKSDSKGLKIINSSTDVLDDILGISLTSNSTNTFNTAISADGYKIGLVLGNSSTNVTGSVIIGEGTKSTYELGQGFYGLKKAIKIEDVTEGIDIKTATDGIVIDTCSSRGINILNSATGINIFNSDATYKTGININNAETGISISSTTTGINISSSTTGINISSATRGITIQGYSTKGIQIDHVEDKSHMRLIPSPSALPSNDEELGDIFVGEDGTTTKLYLYGNVSGTPAWREVQFV